jgi:hypothetical protein
VDHNGKLRVSAGPAEVVEPDESKDVVRPLVRAFAAHLAPAIVILLYAGVLIGMTILAPLIWRSPADRVCQEAGYWYATDIKWREVSCWKIRKTHIRFEPPREKGAREKGATRF